MDVKNPAEKAGELAAEADRGRSERTPWLALGGVSLVLSVVIGVLLVGLLILYFALR